MIDKFVLDRLLLASGDRAQPPGRRLPGLAFGLQVAGYALETRAAGLKQARAMQPAPARA